MRGGGFANEWSHSFCVLDVKMCGTERNMYDPVKYLTYVVYEYEWFIVFLPINSLSWSFWMRTYETESNMYNTIKHLTSEWTVQQSYPCIMFQVLK